jgi:hypothetical protein
VIFGVIVNYNTTSSTAPDEVAMPTRLLSLLLRATTLAATGAIVVALAQGAATRRDAALDKARAQQMAPAAGTPALLPTIVVRPEAVVPTLATVTVHARRVRDTVASADPAPAEDALDWRDDSAQAAILLQGGGFDMPYYSFGRSLRRVNKE